MHISGFIEPITSDLGVTGKIFPLTMMPILVKDDDIRSGTKAKAKCKKVVDEAPCTEKACCFSLDSSHCWKNVLVLNTCRYILFNNYSSISGYFQMLLQIHWVPCGLLLAS